MKKTTFVFAAFALLGFATPSFAEDKVCKSNRDCPAEQACLFQTGGPAIPINGPRSRAHCTAHLEECDTEFVCGCLPGSIGNRVCELSTTKDLCECDNGER
jgi:hypothetical protein